jgi:hypothetical protein
MRFTRTFSRAKNNSIDQRNIKKMQGCKLNLVRGLRKALKAKTANRLVVAGRKSQNSYPRGEMPKCADSENGK